MRLPSAAFQFFVFLCGDCYRDNKPVAECVECVDDVRSNLVDVCCSVPVH